MLLAARHTHARSPLGGHAAKRAEELLASPHKCTHASEPSSLTPRSSRRSALRYALPAASLACCSQKSAGLYVGTGAADRPAAREDFGAVPLRGVEGAIRLEPEPTHVRLGRRGW